MPSLYGHVAYASELHGWEPSGSVLVEFTQGNTMLDAHRQVLASEFPRRKFETEFTTTIGGLRSDAGTYTPVANARPASRSSLLSNSLTSSES